MWPLEDFSCLLVLYKKAKYAPTAFFFNKEQKDIWHIKQCL